MPPPRSLKAKRFLSLNDATFRLGDRLLFENSTWTFHRYEQWAVIGPNGSGKSVLADCLCGRLPLVEGELRYHFKVPVGLSAEDLIGHVAFEDRKAEMRGTVVQSRWTSFEQDGALRVQEFLSYERVMDVNPFELTPRHTALRPHFERRMRRAIALLQIGGFLSRTLLSLSNGERQRVQIARALAQPLRLLILDEPYLGMDVATRARFHQLLERLLRTPLRILLITARAEELPNHITHLLRIEDCRIVGAGPRAHLMPRKAPTTSKLRAAKVRKQVPPANSNRTSLIELRKVTVRYDSRAILRKLDWQVRPGESWALLGPNGSGKSTLLSLILGDNPQAYSNRVFVFGQRRGSGESNWQLKKRIGWVSAELQLHFDNTVSVLEVVLSGFQETIGLFEAVTPHQLAAARRWLRRFELLQFAKLPLFSLSAGLQRMALLARALVKSPRLLILDEPCQGLDRLHTNLIIQSVDAVIRDHHVTAIFVTHHPEEIPPSITRILRLTADGVPTLQHR